MVTLGTQVKVMFVLGPVSFFFLAALEPIHDKPEQQIVKKNVLRLHFFINYDFYVQVSRKPLLTGSSGRIQ